MTTSTEFEYSADCAARLDAADALRGFREAFLFPQVNGKTALYFTGNSLGLQPKTAQAAIQQELDDWASFGVEGHFEAKHPWYSYHEPFAAPAARLVGAQPHEVVMMNGLTVNLHLMMVSFFRPAGRRTKIITEAKAFPSDQYAVESQLRFHGLDPEEHLIEVAPRAGSHTVDESDIEAAIARHGEEVALVFLGAVNYYSGQWFDMERVTKVAREAGAVCGWDLAHAAGNVPMKLHDWGVDFACWCTYKYLNSGPGSISGVFVHDRHANDADLPRFAGWWGYDKSTRFEMAPGFRPIPGAEGWQLSNAPVFAMAPHKAALALHDEAGMAALREKSIRLTAWLEFVIQTVASTEASVAFEVITPTDPKRRGAQLSMLIHGKGKSLFDALTRRGVIADWREPNVIRLAPVPLYNSFTDVYLFGEALAEALKES